MRVLWVINRILPLFCKELGVKETNFGGGWLTGLSETLRKTAKVQLAVCMPSAETDDICWGSVEGVEYYLYHDYGWSKYNEKHKELLKRVVDEFRPDVIHVFGTEYPRTLEVLDAVGRERVLISLTGILSECYAVYEAGIPSKYTKQHKLLRFVASRHKKLFFLQNRLVAYGKNDFKIRAEYEAESLRKAKFVTGRTTFDRLAAKRLNPNVQYFFCNESLRTSFYEKPTWEYDNCEKHTLFVSNAGYPIKGFHKLLEAAAVLLKKYPDLKIRVAGNSPFAQTRGLKNKLLCATDEYGKYLRYLIKRSGLLSVVEFLGNLDEQRMKNEFLRSNVFVLPSRIENSPNSLGEAMLLKTPCVASDVGGVSEMMKNGEEGLIYTFDDVEALTNAIDKLFSDPAYAVKMGMAAAEHAAKTHCLRKNNETMLGIYHEIMKINEKKG